MTNHHRAYRAPFLPTLPALMSTLLALALVSLSACDDEPPAAPDATAVLPIEATGSFTLQSSFSLSAPPPGAVDALAELTSATDGPDDPSRFLIDKLVARLPEGRAQLVAAAVSPFVAAYVQQRLESFAPHFADNLRQLANGTNEVARRFRTSGALQIDASGNAVHVITGLGFAAGGRKVDIAFAPLGMADVAMHTKATLDGNQLALAEHGADVPYGALVRLGLDRLVVPRVVSGALDLADALVRSVSCERLGAHIAEYLEVGTIDLYARSCEIALMALAAEIYERLESEPVRLAITGSAQAFDANGDGPMDAIAAGTWTGSFAGMVLAQSTFTGAAE
jgi:hypothetical protein